MCFNTNVIIYYRLWCLTYTYIILISTPASFIHVLLSVRGVYINATVDLFLPTLNKILFYCMNWYAFLSLSILP